MSKVRIYLGEVETTRKIRKYVFTGVEGWRVRTSPDNSYYINYSAINIGGGVQYQGICSHFDNPQSGVPKITSGQCYFGTSAVSFRLDDTTDLTQWTNWVAQQYANGTPVTVWYVLATPETGIVNEPLMKIGDYADTVSGISIPTIAGANTLSVDTTLQPSEVTVNYKGWHPITNVHEHNNGAWN